MKRYFLLGFIWIVGLQAQETSSLDSLERQLSVVSNEEKVATLNALGNLFWYKSPAKTRFYSYKALELSTELGDTSGMILALKSLGVASYLEGQYDEALSLNMDCLRLAETVDDKQNIAGALNNIGIIYGSWKQYDEAFRSYERSLDISTALQDTIAIVRSINNMGWIKKEQSDYDEAIDYFRRALAISEKIGDPLSVASTQNNMGEIYFVMGDYDEALVYHLSTLAIVENAGMEERVAWSYHNLAKDYEHLGRFGEAERLFQKSLYRAQSSHLMELVKENTLAMSNFYSKRGQYQRALDYYKQFSAAKDSLLNESTSQQLAEIKTRYEMDKKEQELELLRHKEKIQSLQVARLNKDRGRLIVVVLSVGTIAVGVLFINQMIRKRKRELEEALGQIKRLRGLLPICAHCKKIRDDQGYWNQLETYISENSEVVFSHGICPQCMETLYPEYSDSPQDKPVEEKSEK